MGREQIFCDLSVIVISILTICEELEIRERQLSWFWVKKNINASAISREIAEIMWNVREQEILA